MSRQRASRTLPYLIGVVLIVVLLVLGRLISAPRSAVEEDPATGSLQQVTEPTAASDKHRSESVPRGPPVAEATVTGDVEDGEDPVPPAPDDQVLLLQVLGKDTRDHLDGIEVRSVTLGTPASFVHPGNLPTELIVEDVASPVEIAPSVGRVWIRAEGYAWAQTDLRQNQDQDSQTIRLERGGELEIRLEPIDLCLDLTVTLDDPLFGMGDRPVRPLQEGEEDYDRWLSREPRAVVQTARENTVLLENLRPGKYSLSTIKLGEPALFGFGSCKIIAGQRAIHSLVLQEHAREFSPRAPLSGTLRLPAGLEESNVRLAISHEWRHSEPLEFHREDTIPVGGDPLFLAWDAGEVFPGPWEASIRLTDDVTFIMPYQISFVVGDAGDRDVQLEVPDLAEVHARVVDVETSVPVSPGTVWLGWEPQEGITGRSMQGIPRADEGVCSVRIPAGKVILDVSVRGSDYDVVSVTRNGVSARSATTEGDYPFPRLPAIQLDPGVNDIVIEVKKRIVQGIRMVLESEGTKLRMPSTYWSGVWLLDETGGLPGGRLIRRGGDDQLEILVSVPGSYLLRIPPVEGYHPVPEKQVDVRLGEILELIVQLGRDS